MGIVEGAALVSVAAFGAGMARLFAVAGFTPGALVAGCFFAAGMAALSFAALAAQLPQ